jgi:predicted exporter
VTGARRAVLAAWLLALAACAAWLHAHLTVQTEMTVFLPPSATPAQRLLLGQLREGVASRTMLIELRGAEPAALARASGELARALRSSGLFALVANGDPALLGAERDLVLAHRYLLSPAVTEQRFSAAGLAAALQEDAELLASPAGALLRPTLPRDPTGELREIGRLLAPAGGPRLAHGVWFSRDGDGALLSAETRAPAFDVDAQARAVAAVRAAAAQAGAGQLAVAIAGPGVFAAQMREAIERESWRLSLIASLLVLAILAVAYRSAGAVAACALPVASGLVVGITAVALGFGAIHGITLAFGATLIGETVDYPSYLLIHNAPGEPLWRTLARIGATLRLAVLTTVFGATALAFSSFAGLAQLGWLTVAGVMAGGLATALVAAVVPPGAVRLKHGGLAAPRFALAGRLRRIALWTAVILVALAAAFIVSHRDRLWDEDLANLSPIPEASKALDQRLRAELGAPDLRYVLVARGAGREAALEKSEAADAWLAGRVAQGELAGYDAASRYLPSRRTQQARHAALPDQAALARNLAAAVRRSPFREGVFAPFLADVARARGGGLLDAEALAGTALGVKLSALLVRDGEGWAALAPLRGVTDGPRLAAAAGQAGFELLDLKEESNRLVGGYRAESLRLFGMGFAAIAALLAFSLRSVGRALRVLAPVAAAALLDVALLALLGRQLSLFNLVALLLVVGVGLNYALFFERPQADPAERSRTRLAIAVCAATTLAVFGCLMLSQAPVLRAIGETVFFGCLLAAALSAAFAARAAGYTRPDA